VREFVESHRIEVVNEHAVPVCGHPRRNVSADLRCRSGDDDPSLTAVCSHVFHPF